MSQNNKLLLRSARGTTFSSEQYHLLFNYLKTGNKPPTHELKSAHFLSHQAQSLSLACSGEGFQHPNLSTWFRFSTIASRLKLREDDQELVFKRSNKIVLPCNRFHEVIRFVHRNDGQKHLNISKTLEKLADDYAIGCRQFGICEENVRVVVKKCSVCSRAGRSNRTPVHTPKKQNQEMLTNKTTTANITSTATTSTTTKTSTGLGFKTEVKPLKGYESIPGPSIKPVQPLMPVSFPVQFVRLPTGQFAMQHVGPNVPAFLQQWHQVSGRPVHNVNSNTYPVHKSLAAPGVSNLTGQPQVGSVSTATQADKNLGEKANQQMPCLAKMLQSTSNKTQSKVIPNSTNNSSDTVQIHPSPSLTKLLNSSFPSETKAVPVAESSLCCSDENNNILSETADHLIVNNMNGPPEPWEYLAFQQIQSCLDSGPNSKQMHTDSHLTQMWEASEDNNINLNKLDEPAAIVIDDGKVSGNQEEINEMIDLESMTAQRASDVLNNVLATPTKLLQTANLPEESNWSNDRSNVITPYDRMLKLIKDMKPHVTKAMGGHCSARYRLKLSISALESMLSSQKAVCKMYME